MCNMCCALNLHKGIRALKIPHRRRRSFFNTPTTSDDINFNKKIKTAHCAFMAWENTEFRENNFLLFFFPLSIVFSCIVYFIFYFFLRLLRFSVLLYLFDACAMKRAGIFQGCYPPNEIKVAFFSRN